MVTKKKATTGTRGIKKLKLKRETLKDLDVSPGKRIKGGTLIKTLGCVGQVTIGCGAGTGTQNCRLTYACIGSF